MVFLVLLKSTTISSGFCGVLDQVIVSAPLHQMFAICASQCLGCFRCPCAFLTPVISVLFRFQCVFSRMSDSESIGKMLRSVLQSSKAGVSIDSLQSEYRSLCGESIPLKKLGYSELEDFLQSIPSVVRLEYRMGEVRHITLV